MKKEITDKQSKKLLERAIKKAGNGTALADVLGVKQNAVSNWKVRGLPPKRVKTLQNYLKGANVSV